MQDCNHFGSHSSHLTAVTNMPYLAIPKPGDTDVAKTRNKRSFISCREAV